MIDQNRDGFIDKEDLHDMLASLGEHTPPPQGPLSPQPLGRGERCRVTWCHTQRWVLALLGCLKAWGDFPAPGTLDRRGVCEVSEGSSSGVCSQALTSREEALGAGETLPWEQPPAAAMECLSSLTPECHWGCPMWNKALPLLSAGLTKADPRAGVIPGLVETCRSVPPPCPKLFFSAAHGSLLPLPVVPPLRFGRSVND